MLYRRLMDSFPLAVPLAMSLCVACGAALAHDASEFPDWSGQWTRTYGGNPRYDQTKPLRKQEAPLKPEYQARFEASIKDQDLGGHGLDPAYTCLPQGMPRMMSGVSPFEFLILPGATYMVFERTEFSPRRIYTDGRDWPQTEETWFHGYSIGKWRDTAGNSRYDTLDFIERSDKKFETHAGERGRMLSGGERQRLSIARALLKDPPILILDEATSALDAVTEAKVNAALDEVMKGRTTFVIAHRLSTIRNATRILVFDNGRVIENGTFDELVAKGGRFAELAKAQFMVQENARGSTQAPAPGVAVVKA